MKRTASNVERGRIDEPALFIQNDFSSAGLQLSPVIIEDTATADPSPNGSPASTWPLYDHDREQLDAHPLAAPPGIPHGLTREARRTVRARTVDALWNRPHSPRMAGDASTLSGAAAAMAAATRSQQRWRQCRRSLQAVGMPLVTVVTLIALVANPLRLLVLPNGYDAAVDALLTAAFAVCVGEIVVRSWSFRRTQASLSRAAANPNNSAFDTERQGFKSAYFYLDALAAATLSVEIPWMLMPKGGLSIPIVDDGIDAWNFKHVLWILATLVSLGGRVMRAARLARLLRRYYRARKDGARSRSPTIAPTGSARTGASPHWQMKPTAREGIPKSTVGRNLLDLTLQRVVIGVVVLLIGAAAMVYSERDSSAIVGARVLQTMAAQSPDKDLYGGVLHMREAMAVAQQAGEDISAAALDGAISSYVATTKGLLYLSLGGAERFRAADRVLASLRPEELVMIRLPDALGIADAIATVSVKDAVRHTARNQLVLAAVVFGLLITGVHIFGLDVKRLVLTPLEQVHQMVQCVAANPLDAKAQLLTTAAVLSKHDDTEDLETTALLKAMDAMAGLLRVGFGDAGADIIARNLRESSNNRLNLLTSGTMARAVFGFCDIRAFTDTTECLREEVMPFVNRVARLLHAIARRYGGSAGGSAGDAFLLTWPATICGDRGRNGGGSGGGIGGSNSSGGAGRGGGGAGGTGGAGGSSGSSSASLSAGASSSGGGGGGGGGGRGAESVATAADHALLSFLRVIVEMERQQDYICQFSVSAMSRVYQRMPDYKARMGFGLHVGWAVQGAIGSDKKIDTSFMSPHVGLVEFLEACTKTYGVPLLMSKAFYQQLSPNAQAQCRLVDVVQRAPHDPPLHIYAYACDFFKRVTPASDTSELQPFDTGGSSPQQQQQQPPASAPLNITLPRLTVLVNGGGGALDSRAQKERVGQYLRLRRASSMNVVNPSLAWSETVMSGALNRPSVTNHIRNSVVGEVAPFDLDVQRPRTPTPRDADNYGPAVRNPSISADMAGRVMSEAMTVPPAIEFGRQPSVDLGPPPQRSFVFSLPPPEIRTHPCQPSSWLSDPDLRWIRGEHTPETHAQWAAVMAAYVRGDWAAALPLAHAFDRRFSGRDGPCTHLLRVLRAGRPRDWAGHRLLYAW